MGHMRGKKSVREKEENEGKGREKGIGERKVKRG